MVKARLSVAPQPGVLHTCRAAWPTATAFVFGSPSPTAPLVLFVGGTGGTLMSTAYLPTLHQGVEASGWAFAQLSMVSVGGTWGGVDVRQDAVDIAAATRYFKETGAPKIVLVGLSTGCQDLIAYHHASTEYVKVDGIVLQGPVSDREFPDFQRFLATLPDSDPDPLVLGSDPRQFVPRTWSDFWGARAGISHARWHSIAAKPTSDEVDIDVSEDFFSSDLSDARLRNVFGPVECPILFVLSGNDPSYSPQVRGDIPALLDRFRHAAPTFSALSTIVEGASHTLRKPKHVEQFVERVVAFLETV
ncbi:hypothetical protein JCM8208_002047 [Rhodotorula glutinis]